MKVPYIFFLKTLTQIFHEFARERYSYDSMYVSLIVFSFLSLPNHVQVYFSVHCIHIFFTLLYFEIQLCYPVCRFLA